MVQNLFRSSKNQISISALKNKKDFHEFKPKKTSGQTKFTQKMNLSIIKILSVNKRF